MEERGQEVEEEEEEEKEEKEEELGELEGAPLNSTQSHGDVWPHLPNAPISSTADGDFWTGQQESENDPFWPIHRKDQDPGSLSIIFYQNLRESSEMISWAWQ